MVYATPPIACDVSNIQAVAMRVYHYLAGQVKAGIRGQIFSMNMGIIRSLCRGKVMAYPFQRLAVCQTYRTALFTCQRTSKEEFLSFLYQHSIAGCFLLTSFQIFYLSFTPYREWKRLIASSFEEKFLFPHHIRTAPRHFMTKFKSFFSLYP